MTSDFPEKSKAMCQFIDKRGHPVSVYQAGHHCTQQIDRQSALQTTEKENTDRIPFTLTTQLNSSFLKTLNYSKTIQRPVLSFRNLH